MQVVEEEALIRHEELLQEVLVEIIASVELMELQILVEAEAEAEEMDEVVVPVDLVLLLSDISTSKLYIYLSDDFYFCLLIPIKPNTFLVFPKFFQIEGACFYWIHFIRESIIHNDYWSCFTVSLATTFFDNTYIFSVVFCFFCEQSFENIRRKSSSTGFSHTNFYYHNIRKLVYKSISRII